MTKRSSSASGLVYSTEQGRMCPACRQAVGHCICQKQQHTPGTGNVRVSRETKGRAGKGVTLIKGMALDADSLATTAKRFRTACGAGGTVKEGVIEIQGDHVERVLALLSAEGITAKRAGG